MLGVSGGLLGSSGDGAAAAAAAAPTAHESSSGGGGGDGEVGGGGSNSGVFGEEEKGRIIEDGDRNSAGNRWPRQETMALLKIRSDMDVAFRDSSLKGPLWEEVSRKLAELGYQRSAKKCKEKFENVYKYHKRTKDGRATKPDGKTYRFFDQLQALEHHPPPPLQPPSRPQTQLPLPPTMPGTNNPPTLSHLTVLSTKNPIPIAATPITISHNISTLPPPLQPQPQQPTSNPTNPSIPSSLSNVSVRTSPVSNSTSSSSTSTSSDQELFEEGRRKRKRKWKDFFEKLMKDVIEKQEELQKKFLDTIEKREHDRMVREEAWKMQEMARMNREHEILVHERSMAAAKDAAVMAFLQKISEQHNTVPVQLNNNPSSAPVPTPPPPPPPSHPHQLPHQHTPVPTLPLSLPPPLPPPRPQTKALDIQKLDNGENLNSNSNSLPTSSSRWPKAEVQALIQLRTNLDIKYQDNGPKGPLWEEISAGLRKIGYNRNAKRCKEKWENINKYFKKVKESNKQRPEDSKTCPYFHLLDALYKEKNKNINSDNTTTTITASFNPSYGNLKPENNPMVPLMVEPEQQWPLQPSDVNNVNQNKKEDDDNDEEEEDDDQEEEDGDDDDDEDEGGGFEIVSNKPSSMGTVE